MDVKTNLLSGKNVVYIHYGNTSFDPDHFLPVKNSQYHVTSSPACRGGGFPSTASLVLVR